MSHASALWRRLVAGLMCQIQRMFGLTIILLYRRNVRADRTPSDAEDSDFSFATLQECEVRAFIEVEEFWLSEAFVIQAIGRGAVCFGAFQDGRPAAYVWYGTGAPMPYCEGLDIMYGQSAAAYGFNIVIRPEFRGKRLASSLVRFGDSVLAAEGYEHVFGFVEFHNWAGRRAASRYGDLEYCGFGVSVQARRGASMGWMSPKAGRYGLGFRTAAEVEPAAGNVAAASERR